MNAHDPKSEEAFHQHVSENLTRNYVSQLIHGMLAMTGFRLVNAPTFVPAYLYLLSGSELIVGAVLASQQFGAFFSSLFGATAIEHRKRILPMGFAYGWAMRLSVLGLSLVAFFVPPPYALWIFALFLGALGVFSGMQNVLWNVLMTKTIPANRRGMLIGARNFLGGMTASAVALLGGSYFVTHNTLGNGYATTFLLAFVLTSLGLGLLALVREPDAPSVRERTGVRERLGHIPDLLKAEPQFARYFYAQALATCGTLALPFYILYAGKTLGLTGETLGSLSFALLGSQTAANLLWGAIADRIGFKAVFVPALFLWAASTVVLAISGGYWIIVASFIGIGAGYSGFLIAAQNMVMEFGSRADLPLRLGMVNSAQSLVQGVGPVVGGLLAISLGYEAVFAVAVLAKLAAAVILWFYVSEPRRPKSRGEVSDSVE